MAFADAQRILFQSLTRDSNHSNVVYPSQVLMVHSFNPSRGIAIIQTLRAIAETLGKEFQSLTRDSNHSNLFAVSALLLASVFQSLTRDSNHSNSRIIERELRR